MAAEMRVGFPSHSGFFDVRKEELAQPGGGDAALKIGVVEIVSREIAELLGDVFVFPPAEGEGHVLQFWELFRSAPGRLRSRW